MKMKMKWKPREKEFQKVEMWGINEGGLLIWELKDGMKENGVRGERGGTSVLNGTNAVTNAWSVQNVLYIYILSTFFILFIYYCYFLVVVLVPTIFHGTSGTPHIEKF